MRNLEFNKYTGSYFFYNEEEDVKELTKPRNGDIIKFNDDFSYEWKGDNIYDREMYNWITVDESGIVSTNIFNYSDMSIEELSNRFQNLNDDGFIWESESPLRHVAYPRTIRESYRVEEINISETTSSTTFDVAEFNEMNRLYEQELNNER